MSCHSFKREGPENFKAARVEASDVLLFDFSRINLVVWSTKLKQHFFCFLEADGDSLRVLIPEKPEDALYKPLAGVDVIREHEPALQPFGSPEECAEFEDDMRDAAVEEQDARRSGGDAS